LLKRPLQICETCREESVRQALPLRLSELVKQYPYLNASENLSSGKEEELPFLPIPRFTTRKREVLFVRIDALLPAHNSPAPSKEDPLQLIIEALKAAPASDVFLSEDAARLWKEIKAKASEASDSEEVDHLYLSKILDDETLRILSLVPTSKSGVISSPTSKSTTTSSPSTPLLRVPQTPVRTRSASVGVPDSKNSTNGVATSLTNWTDFSTTGFGDLDKSLNLTLSDSDATASQPSASPTRRASPSRGRAATAGNFTPRPASVSNGIATTEDPKLTSSLKRIEFVEVDEAFADFWNDALLDPISSEWPSFVIGQLKSPDKASLLLIEQTYSRPAPPLPPAPEAVPRPSMSASVASGRKSFTFSPAIKRFSFFNTHGAGESSKTGAKKSSVKSGTKSPRIGELGEILPEEEEPPVPPIPAQHAQPAQGVDLTNLESSPAVIPASPVPSPKTDAELPPVPLIEAELPPVPEDVAPVATGPVRTESDAPEKPTASIPEDVIVPADKETPTEPGLDSKELPPAPDSVVLTGGTPGPQVALDSSEPAAMALAAENLTSTGVDEAMPEPIAVVEELSTEEKNPEGPPTLERDVPVQDFVPDEQEQEIVASVEPSEPVEPSVMPEPATKTGSAFVENLSPGESPAVSPTEALEEKPTVTAATVEPSAGELPTQPDAAELEPEQPAPADVAEPHADEVVSVAEAAEGV
jgi:hypothetical protein